MGNEEPQNCPLIVDLDGTIIKSDLWSECVLAFIRSGPLAILHLPAWVVCGKSFVQQKLADRVRLDVGALPYREAVIDFLRREARGGRRVLLASTAPVGLARQIAEHLGFFHGVLAGNNAAITGEGKRQMILEACGHGPFDYAGRNAADLPLWRQARQAILVNPVARLAVALGGDAPSCRVFAETTGGYVAYLRAARVHQWVKNLLIFLPLLTRGQWQEPRQVLAAFIGFLAFGLAASAIYLLNDLLDLPADRRHPTKRFRPFAAGEIPLWHGGLLLHLLPIGAFALAMLLPKPFAVTLLVYLGVTTAYSFYLKKMVMIDVVTLAILYTLRVIAGAAAIDIAPSFWLLAFSMFIFLSLALVKRYAEVSALATAGRQSTRGRDYRRSDQIHLFSLGTASGYLSILVLALFINSPELARDYDRPEILWLLCPILLYWISRLWIKAGRGEVHEDPLVFAARDRVSRIVVLASIVIVAFAQ